MQSNQLDLQSVQLNNLQKPPIVENFEPVSVAKELETFLVSRNYFEIVFQNNQFSAKKEVNNITTTISGHISQTFTCQICQKGFQEKEQLSHHFTFNHLVEGSLKSEKKSNSSSSSSTKTIVNELNNIDISEQLLITNPDVKTLINCPSCNQKFQRKQQFFLHTIQNHKNQLPLNEPNPKRVKLQKKVVQSQKAPKKQAIFYPIMDNETNYCPMNDCPYFSNNYIEWYDHYQQHTTGSLSTTQ